MTKRVMGLSGIVLSRPRASTIAGAIGLVALLLSAVPHASADSTNDTDTDVSSQVEEEGGEQLFLANCAGCHGVEGEGVSAPPLESSLVVRDAPAFLQKILNGSGGGGYMPAFGDELSDNELAAIASYVRSRWGGRFAQSAISPEEVLEAR